METILTLRQDWEVYVLRRKIALKAELAESGGDRRYHDSIRFGPAKR